MQVIPVFRSLLLAFVVSGSSTHLRKCTSRIASPRCTSFLHGQSQTGVRTWSGKIQTRAEREMRGQGEAVQHLVLLEE